MKCKITHNSIDKLLALLNTKKHIQYLPNKARTLLNTNTNIVTKSISNMKYLYINIISQLIKIIDKCNYLYILDTIPPSINIDGMSPFNSSSKSLWPILISINKKPYYIFLCTLTYGNTPSDNDFMKDMIEKSNILINNGIHI